MSLTGISNQHPPRKGKKNKQRLDDLLVEHGFADDRAQAQRLVLAGEVFSDNQRFDKPGILVSSDTALRVKSRKDHPWVSRGGIKLAHALQYFKIDCVGKTAIDVGSSTGGFTDVLLHHKAEKIYAVDVGYGELAWKLQQDPHVVVLERTNARHLTSDMITAPVDMVVCDASFISLERVLPVPLSFVRSGGMLLALVKPQFEAANYQIGEGGIVTDPAVHQAMCDKVEKWLNSLPGWEVSGIVESPITGMEGNKEFLLMARYHGEET